MKTARQREVQSMRSLPARALRATRREIERAVSSRFLRRHVKRSLWSVWKPVLKGNRQSMVADYVKPVIAGNTEADPWAPSRYSNRVDRANAQRRPTSEAPCMADLTIPTWLKRGPGDQKPLNRPTRSIAAPLRLQGPKANQALKAASAAERAKIDEAVARACDLAEHGKVKR